MPRKVRKYVDREFARTVDLTLFKRFLAPFIDKIEFDWDTLPGGETEQREAIFEFFRGADDRFPAAMQNALHAASILSTESGSRVLQEQADLAGVSLVPREEIEGPEDGRHLNPRHLALRAYLDHRALFDRAVDITAFWSVSSPAEFVGAREGVEARHEDATARTAFVSAASVYFSSRYKGRYCDVRWYPEDDEVNLLVLHGRNPRTANVEQDGAESTLNYREIAQDSIRYHAASGRVRVGAASVPDRKKLVELFAEHLLGDPEFFKGSDADQLYTLDPIRTKGTGFRFRRGWDEDVLSVTVREIQVDEGEHMADGKVRYSPWAMTVRDNQNAILRLGDVAPDVDFANLRINYVVLDFRFDGAKNPVRVKIKPPSVASFRDHSFEKTIMEHLERNGIRIANTSQSASAAAE